MQYAVIQTGGKQYKVHPGSQFEVEKLAVAPKSTVKFTDILLIAGEGAPLLGTPTIQSAYVEAEAIEQIKAPKIRTATYKAKSRYRKVKGHRQLLTRVKITRIVTREKKKTQKK